MNKETGENKIREYTCPSCGEKETTAIAVKNVDRSYVYVLETEELIEDNDFEGDNNFEYHCPDCHQPLPHEITKKFYF